MFHWFSCAFLVFDWLPFTGLTLVEADVDKYERNCEANFAFFSSQIAKLQCPTLDLYWFYPRGCKKLIDEKLSAIN